MTTGLAPVTPIRPDRPSRSQIEPAALALLSRHSAQILATARRYSATPEDAEDAYQRGVEILLTRAPTTREAELLPWLKTVVKHEAFAVRRANGRAVAIEQHEEATTWSEEQAEHHERLRVGAEAIAGLKPQEIRCLLLRAEGLSYNEICEATGWTYTKVNRCLTEGRRAFSERLAGIESGAECERLTPLLSRLADGEADAADMQRLRPHLRNCLACRATLRSYRAAPARAAALVPPVIAAASLPGGGSLLARVADLLGFASANKVVAVAASAAALAGGGAAGYNSIDRDPPPVPASAFKAPAEPAPVRAAHAAGPPAPRAAPRPARTPAARRVSRPAPARVPPPSPVSTVEAPQPPRPVTPVASDVRKTAEPGEFGP